MRIFIYAAGVSAADQNIVEHDKGNAHILTMASRWKNMIHSSAGQCWKIGKPLASNFTSVRVQPETLAESAPVAPGWDIIRRLKASGGAGWLTAGLMPKNPDKGIPGILQEVV